MASPSNLDFPLPPRSSVTSLPQQLDNASECANVNGISSSRLLSLVHRYRSQAVTLVARQELLLSEQKVVFELERQLWNTEREIWEEERRLLAAESQNGRPSFADDTGSVIHADGSRISVNARNLAGNAKGMNRRRESSGGGSGIAWFLKQGRQPSHHSVTSVDELVSPRDYSNPNIANLRHAISSTPGGQQARTPMDPTALAAAKLQGTHLGNDDDDEHVSDDELNTLPASLLAEASRIVYGNRPEQVLQQQQQRATASGGGGLRPPSRPTLFTSLSINGSSKNALSLDSRSTGSDQNKHSNYLASASEDDSEPDPNEIINVNRGKALESTPKNSVGNINSNNGNGNGKKPMRNGSGNNSGSGSDGKKKKKEESDVPLKLKPTQNFGSGFGVIKPVNIRGKGTEEERGRRRKKHARGKSNHSNGPGGKSTFYDPETPVDSFGSNVSYIDKGWPPSFNPDSAGKLSAVGSLGAQSTQSNATIKTAPSAVKVDQAEKDAPPTPWGKASTNKSTAMASPMLSMSDDSRPNSLITNETGQVGTSNTNLLSLQRDTALLSMKSTLSLNSSIATSPSPPPSIKETRESRQAQNMVNNDSPTYTWSPPALITSSPKSPSAASGQSSHSSHRAPLSATDPPSSIMNNPRISAVLPQLPLHPFSPPLSATPAIGTTTLSISSIDTDELYEPGHGNIGGGGGGSGNRRDVEVLSTHSEAQDQEEHEGSSARRWTDPLELSKFSMPHDSIASAPPTASTTNQQQQQQQQQQTTTSPREAAPAARNSQGSSTTAAMGHEDDRFGVTTTITGGMPKSTTSSMINQGVFCCTPPALAKKQARVSSG